MLDLLLLLLLLLLRWLALVLLLLRQSIVAAAARVRETAGDRQLHRRKRETFEKKRGNVIKKRANMMDTTQSYTEATEIEKMQRDRAAEQQSSRGSEACTSAHMFRVRKGARAVEADAVRVAQVGAEKIQSAQRRVHQTGLGRALRPLGEGGGAAEGGGGRKSRNATRGLSGR